MTRKEKLFSSYIIHTEQSKKVTCTQRLCNLLEYPGEKKELFQTPRHSIHKKTLVRNKYANSIGLPGLGHKRKELPCGPRWAQTRC